jgi:hypothetical protein
MCSVEAVACRKMGGTSERERGRLGGKAKTKGTIRNVQYDNVSSIIDGPQLVGMLGFWIDGTRVLGRWRRDDV